MPISTPPPAVTTSARLMSQKPTAVPSARPAATRTSTSAVASLSRLSPSRMVTTRRGSPIRRAIAVADTASGGATTAPSATQAAQRHLGQQRVHARSPRRTR